MRGQDDGEVLAKMLLYEDPKVFVFNKPAGLAVQGGSGVSRHVDDMLEAWRNRKGEKPRLVHRLDRDTSGVLVVARTRLAAMKLAEAFRQRETKKTYWALVKGVPQEARGQASRHGWSRSRRPTATGCAWPRHGEKGADHAVSYYRVDRAGGTGAVLAGDGAIYGPHPPAARPCGRISAARSSATRNISRPTPIGTFRAASRTACICTPAASSSRIPTGASIDVTAPMPPHMRQSWNLLGFDEASAGEH